MFKKGFTLIELLVYIAIFAVAAGMLTGILATFVRIQSRETASAAVSQELSFVQTTIQRLVRESINIENPPGVASSTLILRMASSTLDPTIISSDANAIYLKQGSRATSTLTSNRVKVSEFQAVKYENPGGHAITQIDLSLTYNSQKIYQQITQNLKTSIGRVTAATFDDNLIPNDCTISNQFSLGLSSCPWKTLSLSNVLNLGQLTVNPAGQNGSIYYNTTDNVFRGYKAGAWQNLGEGFWAVSSANIYNTNSGNVGIGTTSPGVKLQVVGTKVVDSQSAYEVNIWDDTAIASNPVAGIAFTTKYKTDGSYAGMGSIQVGKENAIDNNLASYMALTTRVAGGSVTERVRITSSGDVGIGTTEPGRKLDVADRMRVRTGGAGSGGIWFANSAGTELSFVGIQTESAPDTVGFWNNGWGLVLNNTGNVGIGTTNPQSTLQITGNYIQFPNSWSNPPANDCDQELEYGRVMVILGSTKKLAVCTNTGWQYIYD